MAANLLEEYGGLPFVSRLVMDFYDRVLATGRLARHFEGVDMRRLVDHQAKFVSTLLGGPISYDDETLAEIHAGLDIEAEDFDAMIAALEATLAASGLRQTDRDRIVDAFRRRRGLLVTG